MEVTWLAAGSDAAQDTSWCVDGVMLELCLSYYSLQKSLARAPNCHAVTLLPIILCKRVLI